MTSPRTERVERCFRVPFVRRCLVERPGVPPCSAFLVNISRLGAYVAVGDVPVLGESETAHGALPLADLPVAGEAVTCRFRTAEGAAEVSVAGVVAWLRPRQQHPVHSMPPGFGVQFARLGQEAEAGIEAVIAAYLALHPEAR